MNANTVAWGAIHILVVKIVSQSSCVIQYLWYLKPIIFGIIEKLKINKMSLVWTFTFEKDIENKEKH